MVTKAEMDAKIEHMESSITQNLKDGHADLREQLKSHYISYRAMWYFAGGAISLMAIMAGLYCFITPLMIDSRTSGLSTKVDSILQIVSDIRSQKPLR